MPVPLTTAALAFAAILALIDAELPAIIVGGAGTLNQAMVTFVTPGRPNDER